MSLFEQRTKVVELTRGYVDEKGTAHRLVTLRVPMIEDEIRADAAIAKLRVSASEAERAVAESGALHTLAMVRECIMAWEGITVIQLDHLRQLSRADAAKLIAAFYELEAEDAQAAKQLVEQGATTEGKSESG